MDGVDIDDLQGDIALAECLTNWATVAAWSSSRRSRLSPQAKGRSTGPGLFGEAEDPTIEPAVFTNTPDAHRDGELGDTIMSRRHETHAISIGIDHGAWCPDARSRNDQLAIAAGRCGRQRFDVMIEFYDRVQRVVPVLFLAAANRQDMIEAKADIVLPEPQHWLQIVRQKSDVDDVFCELHLQHH